MSLLSRKLKRLVRIKPHAPEQRGTRIDFIEFEPDRTIRNTVFKRLRLPLTLLALAAVAVFSLLRITSHELPTVTPEGTPHSDLAPVDADTVILTPEKIASGLIQVTEVQRNAVQSTKTLPGRLVYNQERHVDVKSACEGILVTMPLRPGEPVRAGDVVAVVSSPEVGNARALVRAHAADEQLAAQKLKWLQELDQGVQRLVQMIRAADSPASIQSQLASESLGRYRERLVEPYTRSILASQVAANSREAASMGAIPGRIQQEREREFRSAQASLESALEQSTFDARQECDQARAKWEQARERWEVSRQELQALLGPASDTLPVDATGPNSPTSLSQVMLRAPLDGTLEARMLAVGERVAAGQTIVTVADTSRLWVEADVREGDWAAMDVQVGREVLVATPAIPDATFKAQVVVVGRFVDASSGAVPLTSCLLQNDPRLRPGMFVRVEVPYGTPRKSLTIADAAVVVHDGQSFVFLQTGENTFRRVDVETGETHEHRVEIRGDLHEGDPVVVQGAFQLKSELLLAAEEE